MKLLRQILLFTLLVFSSNCYSQAPQTQEEFLTIMLNYIGTVVGKEKVQITSSTLTETDQTRVLAGECNFFDLTNVGFSAKFDQAGHIRRFEVSVPLGPKLSIANMDSILKTNSWSQLFLPKDVRNSLLVSKYFINFTNNLTVDSVGVDFSIPSSIRIFNLQALQLTNMSLGYRVFNPLSRQPQVSGSIDATVAWGRSNPVILAMQSNLVRDPKEWELRFAVGNLSYNSVVENFGVDQFGITIPQLPGSVNNLLTITSAELAIKPCIYNFTITGSSPVGNVNFLLKRTTLEGTDIAVDSSGENTNLADPDPPPSKTEPAPPSSTHKWGLMAGFSLPESNDEIKAISFMKKLGLTNMALVVSTIDEELETSLPIFSNLGSGRTTIQKGFSFVSWISVEDVLNKYAFTQPLRDKAPKIIEWLNKANPIQNILFRANVSGVTIGEFSLEGDINFNDNMALRFKKVELGKLSRLRLDLSFSPISQAAELSMGAYWSMLIDPTQAKPLDFSADMFIKPSGTGMVTIGLSGGMLSNWQNIYAIPGIGFNAVKFKSGLSIGVDIIPIPDDIFMTGQMQYGKTVADATFAINYNEPANSMVLARACNISLGNLVDQFLQGTVKTRFNSRKAGYATFLNDFMNMELKDIYFKAIPPGSTTSSLMDGLRLNGDLTQLCPTNLKLGDNWQEGIRLAANGSFLGIEGLFDIGVEGNLQNLSTSSVGLTLRGRLSPIRLTLPGMSKPVFSLTGADGIKDSAEIFVDLSTSNIINSVKSAVFGDVPPADGSLGGDRIFFLNAGINIMDVLKGKARIELTTTGYKFKMATQVFNVISTNVMGTIGSFRDPLNTTSFTASMNAGQFQDKVLSKLTGIFNGIPLIKEALNSFRFDSITTSASLKGLNSEVTAKIRFRVAGNKFSSDVNFKLSDLEGLVSNICNVIKDKAVAIYQAVVQIALDAINLAKQVTLAATNFAKNTFNAAVADAAMITQTVSRVAATSVAAVRSIIDQSFAKCIAFAAEFGRFSARIVNKLYKDVAAIINGGDNKKLLMQNGPGYRMLTKFPGLVVYGQANSNPNLPARLSALQMPANYPMEQNWQLFPFKGMDGRFMLVSGYSGQCLTMARYEQGKIPQYCTLIPHESDHYSRELLVMEQVPNEIGWYYLKYSSGNVYMQLRTLTYAFDGQNTTTLTTMVAVNSRPVSDSGKFHFEKAGNIFWNPAAATGPPNMIPVDPWRESAIYRFEGETENYIWRGGTLRLVPDMETLAGLKMSQAPVVSITEDMRVGVIMGREFPSWKTGMAYMKKGDPSIYYIDNGKRRQVPDQETFGMMKMTMNDIIDVQAQDLNMIPAGDPIPVKLAPQIKLIDGGLYKATGETNIYKVELQKLRAIPDTETFRYMGYVDTMVVTVSKANLSSLPTGIPIPSRKQGKYYAVQFGNGTHYYIIDHGVKREISMQDTETWKAMGISSRDFVAISFDDWKMIAPGYRADGTAVPAAQPYSLAKEQ